MAEKSQWYYTDRNGAQAGPVSIAELRSLIHKTTVSDQSMVWSEGMPDWKPVGSVEILAEAPTPSIPQPSPSIPEPSALAKSTSAQEEPTATAEATTETEVNPYASPQAAPVHFDDLYGDVDAYEGIGRLNYFVKILLLFVVLFVGAIFAGAIASVGAKSTLILILIGLLAFLVFYIRIAYLRLKNMGASGWWLLFMLVPIANNVLAIALLSCPEGFAHHKKMDTTGIVVASILGGLTLLSFIGNLAAVFV